MLLWIAWRALSVCCNRPDWNALPDISSRPHPPPTEAAFAYSADSSKVKSRLHCFRSVRRLAAGLNLDIISTPGTSSSRDRIGSLRKKNSSIKS